jgi:hypothetical protein
LETAIFWIVITIYFCFGACLHTILVHVVPRAIDTGIDPFRAAGIISIGDGASLLAGLPWKAQAIDRCKEMYAD